MAEDLLLKTNQKQLKTCGLCEDDYKPLILIHPTVVAQVKALSEEWNEEWLGYLHGVVDGKELVAQVYTMEIPKQEVSYASVDVAREDVPNEQSVIGTVHSHHAMGAFFSGTDTGSIAIHHPVCLVYSYREGLKGMLRVELPCGNFKLAEAEVQQMLPAVAKDFIQNAKTKLLKKTYAPITPYANLGYYSNIAPWHYPANPPERAIGNITVQCDLCDSFVTENNIRILADRSKVCVACSMYVDRGYFSEL